MAAHACTNTGQTTPPDEGDGVDAAVSLVPDAAVGQGDAGRPDGSVGPQDAGQTGDAALPGDAGGVTDGNIVVGEDGGQGDAGGGSIADGGGAADAGDVDGGDTADAGPPQVAEPRRKVRLRIHVVADWVCCAVVRDWIWNGFQTFTSWFSSPPTDTEGYTEMEVYADEPTWVTAGDGTYSEEAWAYDTTLAASDEGPLRDGTLGTVGSWVQDTDLYVTPSSTIAAERVAGVVSNNGGNIVSNNGGGVVSNNGSNLVSMGGANLVSMGGANLVSMGGANLVSMGGANFRLLTAYTDIEDSDGNRTTLNSCNATLTYLNIEWGVEDVGSYDPCPDTIPVCSLVDAATAATVDPDSDCGKLGLLLATFSQLAFDHGLTDQMVLIDALKRDFIDGVMDGKTIGPDGLPVDVQLPGGVSLPADMTTTQLAEAARNFLSGPFNASGLTETDFLNMISRMETSDYRLSDAQPPVVAGVETDEPVQQGCVPIFYTLEQAAGRSVDVLVEFDDGTGFKKATRAGRSFLETYRGAPNSGTRNLKTVEAGEPHTFWWNTTVDVPNAENTGPVLVRVSAFMDGLISPYNVTASIDFARLPDSGCNDAQGVTDLPGYTAPRLAGGDINGDGNPDLVTISGTAPGKIALLWGYGTGGFTFQEFDTVDNPVAVAVGDMDRNGAAEVVVGARPNESASVVLVYRWTGTTLEEIYGPVTHAGLIDVAVGDFNFDYALDVIALCRTAQKIVFYVGGGNGTFSAESWMPTRADTNDLAVGDVDGDLRRDAVVVGEGGLEFFNVPDLVLARTEAATSGIDRVSLIDMNMDARMDLLTVVSEDSWTSSIDVGVYTPEFTYDYGGAWGAFLDGPPVMAVAVNSASGIRPDYVFVTTTGHVTKVISQDGDDWDLGTGGPGWSIDAQPSDMIGGDWNDDGFVDLAVSHSTGKVTVLMNDGYDFFVP
ncbi:MAG: VCBS repeat-containing protein [Myxococcota bacterium]